MTQATQTAPTERTAAPSEADFPQVADRYRRELFAHCYRMTGSVHDAEDLVQETYLRAWKAYHAFENRSSLRTWLYRIATNTCLTALEGRNRRPLPVGLGGPNARPGDDLEENHEVPWLEPVPDAMVGDDHADPAEVAVSRENIRLAFIAALQFLPSRQRAVLLLRDVLRWSAAEVAEVMHTSTAAVNSLLQRAHAQLEQVGPLDETAADASALTAQQQVVLEQYVEAFWEKDVAKLVTMFTQDAIWEMPPYLNWYRGPVDIGRLIGEHCPGGRHDMRMIATEANGQPAFGLYMRTPEGDFRPFHLQVLSMGPDAVHHVAAFFDLSLFATFGLPEFLPAEAVPAGSGTRADAAPPEGVACGSG
jgi:RNA polymerase sigma-70 factor (ECF subfamily)